MYKLRKKLNNHKNKFPAKSNAINPFVYKYLADFNQTKNC